MLSVQEPLQHIRMWTWRADDQRPFLVRMYSPRIMVLPSASPLDKSVNEDLQFQDQLTLLNLIKSCQKEKNLQKARRLHADILEKNLITKYVYVSTALITTYAKCGAMVEAREVFEQLPMCDVVSWSALIAGYAQNGLGAEALKCFQDMQNARVRPNAVTYICVLKACGVVGCLEIGKSIDAEVRKQGLVENDVVLGTALVNMYSKCGALDKAKEVFDQIPKPNVVTWSALIAGYAQNGFGDQALKCFTEMKVAGICPNEVTYICVLKACTLVGSIEIGESIDAEVRRKGLLQKDVVLGNTLVDMYCKCGALEKAREVFEHLPIRDVVTWNALITGYAQNGLGDEVLKCFIQMQNAGVRPDAVTYICTLKACSIVGSLKVGEDIEAEVKKQGLLLKDIVLGTALLDMYTKCGAMGKAREVFGELPKRNVVCWNAMISGFVHNGLGHEALKCFRKMKRARVCPDVITYICILKACAIVGSLEIGEDIDTEVRKLGLLEKDVVLGTALIDMYSMCGALRKAQEVFQQLPVWDVVSWNAIITAYAQSGLGDEALKCFRQMQNDDICPDVVTYICILKACGILGSLEIGKDIDADVRKKGLFEKDIVLRNALVDMYSKCGAMDKAREVFEKLPEWSVVSWSSLIAGYGQLGKANVVLNLYSKMIAEGIVPNSVTFVVMLNACSHAGLLKEGEILFDEMCSVYCLAPTIEHHTCMIDLFGRAGHFDKVKTLLYKASHSGHLPVFRSILGSCRKWRNVTLGEWAFEQSVQLDGKCGSAYVCMRNIYMYMQEF